MFSGITLSYHGRKYNPSRASEKASEETGLAKLIDNFSEIGALVIRFHIGQGQRVGLLQQISREDYSNSPLEKPAMGNNQSDLFAMPNNTSPMSQETRILEECCHHSLGRGKVLNERAQPLVHINTKDFRGEQALWDVIHSPVWSTGINLPYQLSKQGFLYICHPGKIPGSVYEAITQELNEGQFNIIRNNNLVQIKTKNGILLETAKFQHLKIDFDPTQSKTNQENGLVITVDGQEAPLGWMIQENNKKLVHSELTDNLIRVIRIAKGGFYELPAEKQKILQSGLLKNNGLGLFTQNQAFNAMEVVFRTLEKEYMFDPSVLMPDSALKGIHERVAKLMQSNDGEVVEDFLTGIIITEMVQHLKKTQPNSTRTPLPVRFTNPFKVTLNNAKAIAHAFDITMNDGTPVLQTQNDKPAVTADNDLIDLRVNGQLLNPDLTHSKHIAALLATSLLVVEQMLIEQLLRDACQHGDNHANAVALKAIIGNEEIYNTLINIALSLPKNEQGPILGLQFSYCDPIIELIRETLGFGRNGLAGIVEKLRQPNAQTSILEHPGEIEALRKLFEMGEALQKIDGISVIDQQSRGVNAGVALVIGKLAPGLYEKLNTNGRIGILCMDSDCETKDMDDGKGKHQNDNSFSGMCPYLSARRSEKIVVLKSDHEVKESTSKSIGTKEATTRYTDQKPKNSSTWCGYFTRIALPVLVVGVSVSYCVNEYSKYYTNQNK